MTNSFCSNASNLEIKSFDPKQMKTDGRRKKSGEGVEKADQKKAKRANSWNTKAKIDALVAYKEFRPLGVGHGEVIKQWMAMSKAINDKLPKYAVPFAKQTIITKFHDLMEQYKGNFTEREVNKSSGRSRFDTDEECEAYTTWQMSLEERTKLKLDVREMAIQGDKRHMKKEEDEKGQEGFEEEEMEKDMLSTSLSPSDPIELLEEYGS